MQEHDAGNEVERDADRVRNREVGRGERRQEPGRPGQHHQDPEPALGSPPPGDDAGEDEAEDAPDRKSGVHTGLRDVVARQAPGGSCTRRRPVRRRRPRREPLRWAHGQRVWSAHQPRWLSMPPAPICLGIRPDETPSRRTARAATDGRSVADEDSRLRGIARISCPRAARLHYARGCALSKARSKKAMTRRSYSAGRAVKPPVCPASGITQIVFGSPAAA